MYGPDPLSYEQAHRRYHGLRRLAYEEAVLTAEQFGLRRAVLTEIDASALQKWRSTWATRPHWSGAGGFPWDLLARRYCRKPRSFHIAIWSGEILCGLGVGWVSKAHERLTLHFLESSPDPRHPLRGEVTFLAFAAAESYARAVGARAMVLKNPLRGVAGWYVRRGYHLAYEHRGKLYFYKNLT